MTFKTFFFSDCKAAKMIKLSLVFAFYIAGLDITYCCKKSNNYFKLKTSMDKSVTLYLFRNLVM